MDDPFPWLAVSLGVSALLLAVVGGLVLLRLRTSCPPLSPEEQAEWAAAPMSPLHKIAWTGVLVGAVECLLLGAILSGSGGAAVYWEDDTLRLQVMAVFILGLVVTGALGAFAQAKADEREQSALAWGSRMQSVAVLVTMALGVVSLTMRFHEEGAIPVVYAYLGFGMIFIVHSVANFFGFLVGLRATRLHGQG